MKEILESFAKNFVLKQYRDRFVHETLKKPDVMMRRICHQIQQVFPEEFLSKEEAFDSNLEAIHFDLVGNHVNLVWSEAKEVIKGGGGGNLFISAAGDEFFADSEGEPPEFYYSGSL